MKHTRISSKLIAALLCIAAALPLAGCGESKMYQTQIFAMDTEMTLTAYGNKASNGLAAAKSIIVSLDAMLDPQLETSIVTAINTAQGSSVVVSGQVAKMLQTAKTVYDRTSGAFDPTMFPLIRRWGFVDGKYYKPTDVEIASELSKRCFDKLVLTSFPSSGSYSMVLPANGELSFAALAKGCAAENAVNAMRQQGVVSGVVSLGGNVQTLGLKPDGSNWNIAIQDPNNTASYLGVVSVGETAVVTSGSYQRFFTDKSTGKTYHHIFNPATGYPVTNSLSSVTVICEDGTMADCLSTAMYILGENKALNYWRTYGGFEMVLITNSNQVICTKGLLEKFTLSNNSYTLRFTE